MTYHALHCLHLPVCIVTIAKTDAMRRIAAAGSTSMNFNGIPSWKQASQ